MNVFAFFLHQVNGEKVGLPFSPVCGVNIKTKSRYVMLTTDFGLSVRFDGNAQAGNSKNSHPHNYHGFFMHTFAYFSIYSKYTFAYFSIVYSIFSIYFYFKYIIKTLALFFFPKVVTLPSVYRSRVLGLCGNYDGNNRNEYTKPDSTVTRNLNEFGDSWRVTDRQAGLRTTSLPKMVHLHKYRRLSVSVINIIINQLR